MEPVLLIYFTNIAYLFYQYCLFILAILVKLLQKE